MTSLPLAISFSVRHRLPLRTSSLSVPLPPPPLRLPVPLPASPSPGAGDDGAWSGCSPGFGATATAGGARPGGEGVAGSASAPGSDEAEPEPVPDDEGRGVTAFELCSERAARRDGARSRPVLAAALLVVVAVGIEAASSCGEGPAEVDEGDAARELDSTSAWRCGGMGAGASAGPGVDAARGAGSAT